MHAMHSNDDHFTNEIQFDESFHARQISKNKNFHWTRVRVISRMKMWDYVGAEKKKIVLIFQFLNSERRMRQFHHTHKRRALHDPTTTHQVSFIDSKLNPHRSSATDQLNGSHRIQFLQIAFEIHKIPQFYTPCVIIHLFPFHFGCLSHVTEWESMLALRCVACVCVLFLECDESHVESLVFHFSFRRWTRN